VRSNLGYLVGLVGFHALLTGLGLAVLAALRLLPARASRRLVLAAGPAFLTGAVVLALVGIPLVIAGMPVEIPWIVLTALVLIGVAALVVRRGRAVSAPGADEAAADGPARCALALLAAPIAISGLIAIASYANVGVGWDAAHVWTLRGSTLGATGSLTPEVFDSPLLAWVHPDYPILQPLLQGSLFAFLGTLDVRLWPSELWLWALCGIWTIVWLLARGSARRACIALAIVAPVLGAVDLGSNLQLSDADVTTAVLLVTGAAAAAVWLESGSTACMALGVLFLAGAANTKNEGLLFSVLVVAVVTGIALVRRMPGTWRPVLLGLAAFAVLLLPWRMWVHAHGFSAGDVTPPSDAVRQLLGIDPMPRDRGAQLDYARSVLAREFTDGSWSFFVGPFLGIAVMGLTLRRLRPVAALYLVGFAGTVAGMLWVYWSTNQADWMGHIERTGTRLAATPSLLAAVGAAHLAVLALADLQPWSPRTPAAPATAAMERTGA
jgi:hypothetical protein